MLNTASVKLIKDELSMLSNKELVLIIGSLIKFKKENKELVTYLLFDSKDELEYIKSVKKDMETELEVVNKFNVRNFLKLIRRTLRNTKKAIKFSGKPETEVQLLIHFLAILEEKKLPFNRFKALVTIWDRTIISIGKSINLLHEDLRYDYTNELKALADRQ
ncbi:MAG TPA: hypothetical protein VK172_09305 [Lentimicrobium sp.]|nr:hypothetical protein [Lentimicrobium sp.]